MFRRWNQLCDGGVKDSGIDPCSTTKTGAAAIRTRFPEKWGPVRVKKTRQNKEIEPPFRFNRNGKGSGQVTLNN